MRKIFDIPIETFEERYSGQWNRWFPDFYTTQKLKYEVLHPEPLSKQIIDGEFLDIIGTNHFKAQQLQMILERIEDKRITDDDVIFFHDLWFPGIEMLQYVRDALGMKFKIAGILHAGTYDPADFLTQKGMGRWGKSLENAWFQFIDVIFVATVFHKELICRNREVSMAKIVVTGLPYYNENIIQSTIKEDMIVFPHRLAPEKGIDIWGQLIKAVNVGGWEFIRTKDFPLSDYYSILSKAKVSISCASQETWGIAMLESVLSGCIPLVPDALSYKELFPPKFRYSSFKDAYRMLEDIMSKSALYDWMKGEADKLREHFIIKGSQALPSIVSVMETMWGKFDRKED